MSKAFYPKMALSNINKNRKTYFPYIITCILTIMMYFMMCSILYNENVKNMNHGENVIMFLGIGLWVTGIFAVIFLFYTNSFLIKRRHKEIGLYNILGMEKRHIGRMMSFETLFTGVISLVVGILLGILFGKLMFLLLFKLLGSSEIPGFQVPLKALVNTVLLTAGIFVAILFYNLARIHLTNPIELVHGEQIGEKEPKTKIVLTLIGLATMGSGYAFAQLAKSPLAAVNFFFGAVILVIIGTYCLFTSGSIALIKLLRRNKKFYYQTKHFTSVSGMLYRMKQNAVGLANICILSTMVLVSVSTTVSMYLGMEDALNSGYPSEINLVAHMSDSADVQRVDVAVADVLKNYHTEISDYSAIQSMTSFGEMNDAKNQFAIVPDANLIDGYSDRTMVCLAMTIADYNRLEGSHYQLNKGEVVVYNKDGFDSNSLEISTEGKTFSYQVKEKIKKNENAKLGFENYESMISCYAVMVSDEDELFDLIHTARETGGEEVANKKMTISYDYSVQFNTNLSEADSRRLNGELAALDVEGITIYSDSRYEMREEFHQMYGGFLFIGMFVGALFLMATVLIIYYKQISEGYEDKERFEIMQKVGMSKAEVKKTIRSQVLMVFFMPLVMATIHVLVSFRIIKMILAMLALGNTDLFLICTLATVFIFCLIYAIVFAITERSYYKIVSTSL